MDKLLSIDFKHQQAKHYETGVTKSLLSHNGLELSEPMIFGIGSGIFLGHFPFLKLHGVPITTFRSTPGSIFQWTAKRIGAKYHKSWYRIPKRGMNALDKAIEEGYPVGLQVDLYRLSYLPVGSRFHYNSRNIIVFGKENGNYKVSDPLLSDTTELSYAELTAARYSRGPFAPLGKLFYLKEVPSSFNLETAIKNGIGRACNDMLDIPAPFLGHTGYKFIAKRMRKWPNRLSDDQSSMWIDHFIKRMEGGGTSGSGYRSTYASFLREASKITGKEGFEEMAEEMDDNATLIRELIQIGKDIINSDKEADYEHLADLLIELSVIEKQTFKKLRKINRQ